MKRPRRSSEVFFYLALAILSLATLMQEILLTRIFSVITWYHYAFLAVSVAMFGITVGAVSVYLFQARFSSSPVETALSRYCSYFAASVVLSCLVQVYLPFGSGHTVEAFGSSPLSRVGLTVVGCVVISLPFFFNGLCLALIFRERHRSIGPVYAADLAGAGLGCAALPLLLDVADAPSAVLLIAFLGTAAAWGFSASAGEAGRTRTLGIVALAVLSLGAVNAARFRAGDPLIRIRESKGHREQTNLHEKWNSFSRVRVYGLPDLPMPPLTWGPSPHIQEAAPVRQIFLNIDGSAQTVMTLPEPDLGNLDFLKLDIVNVVHYLRPNADVAVVGAGGGRDILSALVFDQKSVLAVEINDAIVELLTDLYLDFTGGIARHPRVELVNDEARSYLTRLEEKKDIIQVSLIDTWAATASGAYAMVEHSLYTLEAWQIFFDRLSERGIFSTSRWYSPDRPWEVYRSLALATAMLESRGIAEPGRHIMLVWNRYWGQPQVGVLLVSKTPFSTEDEQTMRNVCEAMFYEPAFLAGETAYPELARLASPDRYRKYLEESEWDLSPPDDDRPFFFHFTTLGALLDPLLWRENIARAFTNPINLLGVLLAVFVILTVACILIPLWLRAGTASLRGSLDLIVYFCGIGLGFILAEIALMQRLSVFLGHPVYGLTVVLFGLLVAGGAGSFLTSLSRQDRTPACLALLLVVLTAIALALPSLIRIFAASGTPTRILVSLLIITPAGLLMGTAFPLGIRRAAGRSRELIPWLWGINGATSVVASVLAVALSFEFGISTALWTATALYAVALAAALASRRRARA